MRLFEFVEPVAVNIPSKYPIDDETGLALNMPNQWSQSPYLGAVKNPKGNGYIAQIHIPQDVWSREIEGRNTRWENAPNGLFNHEGRMRPPLRISFNDPRKAAWFVQEVLYGEKDTGDIIVDWLDEKYNGDGGQAWRALAKAAPNFEGEALTVADEQEYFANREARNKAQTVKTNTSKYETEMPSKIRDELTKFFAGNKNAMRKKFGKVLTTNALSVKMDELIKEKGIDYFVTSPGSVKLKDFSTLTF